MITLPHHLAKLAYKIAVRLTKFDRELLQRVYVNLYDFYASLPSETQLEFVIEDQKEALYERFSKNR